MENVFQGIQYRTTRDYYRAIVEAYLYAGGLNSRRIVQGIFDQCSNETLARDCYDQWGSGEFEFSTRRLIDAFADYRAEMETEGDNDD